VNDDQEKSDQQNESDMEKPEETHDTVSVHSMGSATMDL